MKANSIPKFKAGDVVVLRSGGEKMTVEIVLPWHKIHPAVGYICVWMKDGNLYSAEITETSLRIVDGRPD